MNARPINHVESVIVSYDPDSKLLLVGQKNYKHGLDIINAIQGDEATELYQRLKTQKKEGEKKDE